MNHDAPAYGLWILVVINSLVFILFAFSFTHPKTRRDWRSFGAFSAFIVALFAEMYGFPLTIYLISGWLSSHYPGLDLYGHDSGHLWHTLLGLKGDPHFDVLHILSNILLFGGFILLSASWRVLYKAQQEHKLATAGPYAYVRHPQYVGFVLIMFGFLLQWPTIPTLVNYTDDPALDTQTQGWAFEALGDITHQRLPRDSATWRSWYQQSVASGQ